MVIDCTKPSIRTLFSLVLSEFFIYNGAWDILGRKVSLEHL